MYLSERVEDKNARNSEGQTPLMLAMGGNHNTLFQHNIHAPSQHTHPLITTPSHHKITPPHHHNMPFTIQYALSMTHLFSHYIPHTHDGIYTTLSSINERQSGPYGCGRISSSRWSCRFECNRFQISSDSSSYRCQLASFLQNYHHWYPLLKKHNNHHQRHHNHQRHQRHRHHQ